MSLVVDLLSQFGTAVGTVGGASSYLLKRLRDIEKSAETALAQANAAAVLAHDIAKALNALQQGLRMELTAFKTEVVDSAERASRPELGDAKLLADLHHRVEEMRVELHRERDQRHALQRVIQDDARKDAQQWTELNRELAILATKVGILMERRNPQR